ncbi:MAG TPA: hypothetical protein VGB31_05760 [Myxococcota bacterium]
MLKWCRKFPRIRKRGIGAINLLWLLASLVGAAAADEEAAPSPQSVSLDQLLTLPSSLPVESSQRGGLSRGEWNSKFAAAEAEVETAKADLEASLDKLSELVGKTGNWKVAAPGAQAAPDDGSPVNYGLKQEIRRKREEVARTERKLIDLIVEANLAGVPEDWYKKSKSPE